MLAETGLTFSGNMHIITPDLLASGRAAQMRGMNDLDKRAGLKLIAVSQGFHYVLAVEMQTDLCAQSHNLARFERFSSNAG
jgi:hypothetical protein